MNMIWAPEIGQRGLQIGLFSVNQKAMYACIDGKR